MKKNGYRLSKISQEIKKALGFLLINKLNDPRINFMISIVHVDVSVDLSVAKVFFSLLQDNQSKIVVKILNKAACFIRKLLSQRISLRLIPVLNFIYDGSFIKGIYLTKLINRSLVI